MVPGIVAQDIWYHECQYSISELRGGKSGTVLMMTDDCGTTKEGRLIVVRWWKAKALTRNVHELSLNYDLKEPQYI